jgi:hypothetical protein
MLGFVQYITESNPLSRLQHHIKSGRHFVAMSAERTGLTPKENHDRMTELKGKLQKQGFGFKRAVGHWEGGQESSLVVHAKETGHEAGNHLKDVMMKHAKHYDQDSILHHDGETATLHGTNSTGFPGMGKSVSVGKVAYNKGDSEFQTELRPSKKRAPARFTTKE